MADNAEVIVVGAGIAGSAAAYHLASHGVRVTHVEKRFPAGGPSGRSGALLHLFYTEPGLSQLAARGIEILRNMRELTGYPSDYREVGMMTVGGGANTDGYREAVRRIHDDEGGDIRLLSAGEFAELAPAGMNADGIEVAAWEPRSGYADPASATTALARRAAELGATARMNTRISRVLLDGQRAIGVQTTGGEQLLGDHVVLAAGPWTRPLLQDAGVDLPLRVERHIITALDTPGASAQVLPFCWCDDVNMSYGRPEGPDLVLFGSWSGGGMSFRNDEAPEVQMITDPDVYREESDAAEGAEILRYVTPRIPGIASHGIRRGWAGLYDMSPDDLPVIGPVPGIDGLTVIAGSSGHGFKLGPAVGEAVAQLVETGQSPLLAAFSPARLLGQQAATPG
ncbi:MAG TPA: FAD-binding oxidoreductase [Streptosporangiaceae bacterium]|jgi:sarcosine oxidase subunit beta